MPLEQDYWNIDLVQLVYACHNFSHRIHLFPSRGEFAIIFAYSKDKNDLYLVKPSAVKWQTRTGP